MADWAMAVSPDDCAGLISRMHEEEGLEYIGLACLNLPKGLTARLEHLQMISEYIPAFASPAALASLIAVSRSLAMAMERLAAFNTTRRDRVSRFEEGLSLMRKLWTERDVSFHGRYYHMDNVNVDPKPVQKPSIPVIMGGSADAALKRAAEQSDGWVAGGAASAEVFQGAWQKIRGELPQL